MLNEELHSAESIFPKSMLCNCYCFFGWNGQGTFAVAGLNLLAQISDRISLDSVLNCVHCHMLSLHVSWHQVLQSGLILSDIWARWFRPATARYPAHFGQGMRQNSSSCLVLEKQGSRVSSLKWLRKRQAFWGIPHLLLDLGKILPRPWPRPCQMTPREPLPQMFVWKKTLLSVNCRKCSI